MSRRIVLARRPQGAPEYDDFRLEEVACPGLQEDQLLVEVKTFSLDPYMRGRMSARKSYASSTNIDEVMPCEAVGVVLESNSRRFKPGQTVTAPTGWQTHAVVDAKNVRLVPDNGLPAGSALGVLGMPGFTAYAALKKLGRVKAGETLVVAAAAGPVGSAVGQLAKMVGARVIGIAGGAVKCEMLIQELGFDAALDHRSPNFAEELGLLCPDGIDVYFENVGGKIFEAVLPLLNKYARVPVCGMISQYNEAVVPPGDYSTQQFLRLILNQSLEIRGFINDEFRAELWEEFQSEMLDHVHSGSVVFREDHVDGIEQAPAAFIGLLEGKNLGKLLVNV